MEMVLSKRQMTFGPLKETELPRYCRGCDVLFACRGGCPKQRFAERPDGAPGLNDHCKGFKRFYHHVDLQMKEMIRLIRSGIAVKEIMETVNERKKNRTPERL